MDIEIGNDFPVEVYGNTISHAGITTTSGGGHLTLPRVSGNTTAALNIYLFEIIDTS